MVGISIFGKVFVVETPDVFPITEHVAKFIPPEVIPGVAIRTFVDQALQAHFTVLGICHVESGGID